jgi:hypothetical protein
MIRALAILSLLSATAGAKPARREDPLPPPKENTKLPWSRIVQGDLATNCGPPRPATQVGLLLSAYSDAGRIAGRDLGRPVDPDTDDLYVFLDNGAWGPIIGDGKDSFLRARHPNKWKLTRSAYLVEVAVGDGAGMKRVVRGEGNMFATSKLAIVDRSNRFPIDPVATLADARTRFDALVASRTQDIDGQLSAARNATPGKPSGGETQTDWEHYFPSWWEKEQRLEVIYTRVYTRESLTQRYAVELGLRLVYDRTGKLIETKAWPPLPVRPTSQVDILCAYQL